MVDLGLWLDEKHRISDELPEERPARKRPDRPEEPEHHRDCA